MKVAAAVEVDAAVEGDAAIEAAEAGEVAEAVEAVEADIITAVCRTPSYLLSSLTGTVKKNGFLQRGWYK